MNILHISALPVWSMSGKGGMPSLRETLKGHIAGGHSIFLILPQYDPFSNDDEPLFIPENQNIEILFASCWWLLPFKKLREFAYGLTGNDSLPFFIRWILNLMMLLGLTFSLTIAAMKVRRKGFAAHLVYAHNQYAALAGFIVSRLWKLPNVTRLYGTFLADLMQKPFVSFRYPTAAAGYLVPSNLLICANDGTRGDEVARQFGISNKRFLFWQNGITPPSSPPELTREELAARFSELKLASKWVVSCSRLSYWKRIDRMLGALAVCKRQDIDCQLVIAGDGPKKGQLQDLANELGVSGSVVMLGAIDHDDIWALMNTADIFMLTNDVTNRCNPLYEAAWAGLPVVSIYDSSTADLLHDRENSLLSEKDDIEKLGQCLIELCQDDALRKKLCKAQKELSKTFWTWEERMQVEVKALEEIVTPYCEKKGF